MLLGLLPGVRGRALAQSGVGAIGCAQRALALQFPLAPSPDEATPGALAGGPPAGAFDAGEPALALSCAAVFEDPAADDPFALPPGTVSFSVQGPAIVVESGTQSYSVACGDPAQPAPCQAGVGPQDPGAAGAAATPAAALSVHLALQPGAVLRPIPASAFATVQAVYAPADGSEPIVAQTSIDLGQPRYRIELSSDRPLISSGAGENAVISARVSRLLPGGCGPVDGSAYLACQGDAPDAALSGGEPGTLTFGTPLGLFPNDAQSVALPCGDQGAVLTTLVVPAGADLPVLASCTGAAVRLRPAGSAGDATVTVTFSGALTGATATAETRLSIAPQPATIALSHGCTDLRVPSAAPLGAPVSLVVESATPSTGVVSLWRRDASGGWQAGYLRDSDAPVDFETVDPGDQITICVDAVVQFPLG